ncbi:hypothetical protein GGP69_001354 [Salinibacter ruber]|nr:hypothetical protein [Salinibacter ruber]
MSYISFHVGYEHICIRQKNANNKWIADPVIISRNYNIFSKGIYFAR